MWDISNTTTWVSGRHTLNFGVNYRRWWLQRDLATGFLGNYAYNVGFTGNVSPTCCSGTTRAWACSSRRRTACRAPPATRASSTSSTSRRTSRTTGASARRLTLNLGLRWDYRNVPYETNNRMAWRNLDYAPGGLLRRGPVTGRRRHRRRGATTRTPAGAARRTRTASRCSRRDSDSRGGRSVRQTVIRGGYGVFFDSAEGREIDGAADVYPYVSRGNYAQSVGQPTPLQTPDALFPSFAAPGVATPAANTFLAVSQSPQPRNPYVQQWSLGVQRELVPRTTRGDQLHRHARLQSPDAAATSRRRFSSTRPTRSRWRRGSRSRTSAPTSTATGAAARTTTR